MTIAHGAGRRAASLLGSTAGALRTRFVARILDLFRCAESGIFKSGVPDRSEGPIRAGLDFPRDVLPPNISPKSENIAEHIAEVGKDAGIESGVSTGSAAQSGMTISVVCRALLGIGKYRIGFRRFLESVFGLFVSGIAIRDDIEAQAFDTRSSFPGRSPI